MRNVITIRETVLIKSDQDKVWSFTQNFNKRTIWDNSIKKSIVLQKQPFKLVKIIGFSGLKTTLKYKLCKRPFKTSLLMIDTKSLFIRGGGGSWTYATKGKYVEWTQTNTLILKNKFMFLLFGKVLKMTMKRQTHRAMDKAKCLIEYRF